MDDDILQYIVDIDDDIWLSAKKHWRLRPQGMLWQLGESWREETSHRIAVEAAWNR